MGDRGVFAYFTSMPVRSSVLDKYWPNLKKKKTRGPWTLAFCLRAAAGVTLASCLQTCIKNKSPKVKYDGGIGLRIHDFLLVFNSKIMPNSAALRDINPLKSE